MGEWKCSSCKKRQSEPKRSDWSIFIDAVMKCAQHYLNTMMPLSAPLGIIQLRSSNLIALEREQWRLKVVERSEIPRLREA
jgi:hypothetical protein